MDESKKHPQLIPEEDVQRAGKLLELINDLKDVLLEIEEIHKRMFSEFRGEKPRE